MVKYHYGNEDNNDHTVIETVRFITGDDTVVGYVADFIKRRRIRRGKRAVREDGEDNENDESNENDGSDDTSGNEENDGSDETSNQCD